MEASALASVEKAELVHCVWNLVLARVRQQRAADAELPALLKALTHECYTADGALMGVLLPLVVCLQEPLFQRCASDRGLRPSCGDDMLSAFLEALFVSYRDVRLNSSLRRLYYSILTNPFFFLHDSFHQPSHAYHQFLLFVVQEVTSNAGSDGLFFVSLLTAALKQVLNVTPGGQHVQNSEGNGARLRCWQALCVLARRANVGGNARIHELFWKCVTQLNLRDVRHYIDLVGVELIRAYER